VTGVRRDALFASGLQPSDAPAAEIVAQAMHWERQLDGAAGLDVASRWEAGDGRDL